jgi:hypothetical protein
VEAGAAVAAVRGVAANPSGERLPHPMVRPALPAGVDLARCGRVRTIVYIAVARELTRLGVAYTWPAMRGAAALGPGVAPAAVVGGGQAGF